MPQPKLGNVDLHVRLSASDVEVIEKERRRTGARWPAHVVTAALIDLLDATRDGEKGFTIVPTTGELRLRGYRIPATLMARLEKANQYLGYNFQQITRAALARLAGKQRR